MTRQRYNKTESLNRILLSLEGKGIPTDAPDAVTGEVLSEEGALSDLAELLAGSLPNEYVNFPASLLSPYGGIYTVTGTVTLTGITAAWTQITGAFKNSMVSSSDHITSQPEQDRLLINDYGVYRVGWSMSFYGSPAIDYFIEPYYTYTHPSGTNSAGVPQAAAWIKPSASGSAVNVGGEGFVYISGTSVPMSLYIKPSATAWLIPYTLNIHVQRVEKK